MRAQVGQNRSQERKLPPAPLGQAGPLLTKPALPLWGWRPPTTGRCCEVRSTHWAVWAPGSARVKPQLPPKANTCLHYPGLGLSMISSAGLLWGPTTAGSGRGRSGSTFWNFLQRAHVIMINSYKSALRSARGRKARAGPRGPRLSGTSRSPASCAARRPRDRPPPPSLLWAHAQLWFARRKALRTAPPAVPKRPGPCASEWVWPKRDLEPGFVELPGGAGSWRGGTTRHTPVVLPEPEAPLRRNGASHLQGTAFGEN